MKPETWAPVEEAGEYVVTLQTPALLVDPGRHLAPGKKLGKSDEQTMRTEYADIWKSLSDGSLELVNYFHRVSLTGGAYLNKRFQKDEAIYRPYLMTEAGSLFVLRPVTDEGRKKLDHWARYGLEISKEVAKFYGLPADRQNDWWQRCPYLPENGFGEIRVNAKPRYPLAENK